MRSVSVPSFSQRRAVAVWPGRRPRPAGLLDPLELVLGLKYLCGALADDDAGRHRVAGRHPRQNGSIRNTKAIDTVDLQLSIDHRHRITAHFRSAGLMPVRNEPISKDCSSSGMLIETGATSRPVKGRNARELPISRAMLNPAMRSFRSCGSSR